VSGDAFQLGTPRQHAYAAKLLAEDGRYETVLDAAADILERDPEVLMRTPPTVEQATRVLAALKQPAPKDTDKPRFLTARALRQIAQGSRPEPEQLDADARWVLEHLKRSLLSAPVAVNGDGPIAIDHLLQVFGQIDQIAAVFGVTPNTVRGWGQLLPVRYAAEAELRSAGRLRVPRLLHPACV
jgi:hypothetical protein